MRLNQVTLPARDVAASLEFYVALGFVLIVDSAPRYVRLAAPQGDATLSLHAADAAPVDWPAIYLECDALDETVARLRARGVVIDEGPIDQSWLWREAWLRDPHGNRLCLYFAGVNRLDPPWRVSATAVLPKD